MGEMNRKEVMNELYDSTIITLGAVGVGMISRKVISDGLSTPSSLVPTLKLAAAVGISSLAVKMCKIRNGFLLILSNLKK